MSPGRHQWQTGISWFGTNHPRDEDGVYDSSHVWVGTADVMWTGFMLMPHNFFDCSPFYKPCHSTAQSPRYVDRQPGHMSGFNFVLTGVTASDCPASVGGAPISPRVCKEVHDRGLMWKDFASVRRGEELVLWGAIDAAN
jgi:hypothetical protein